MRRFRFPGANDPPHDWEPIPFPRPPEDPERDEGIAGRIGGGGTADDVLQALDQASRRMEDLARALGCLGFDDDDDDPPRAA